MAQSLIILPRAQFSHPWLLHARLAGVASLSCLQHRFCFLCKSRGDVLLLPFSCNLGYSPDFVSYAVTLMWHLRASIVLSHFSILSRTPYLSFCFIHQLLQHSLLTIIQPLLGSADSCQCLPMKHIEFVL